ncbi:MAG: sulfotransferase family 2 domain-containing protein [Cyanobacteria bacterium J06607_15]
MNSLSSQSSLVVNQSATRKAIIAHYHLFKNAGTSVDSILKQNFGTSWRKIEFPTVNRRSNSNLVQDWLTNQQNMTAFSSHTAIFPLPTIDDTKILPILFLRHPLVRMLSVYKFERQHQKILNRSIKLAQEKDFAGYLNHQLDEKSNRSCRNFQTYRLSWLGNHARKSELERALVGLESLPVVGIVSQFDLSMELYRQAIAPYYPSFKVRSVYKNTTSDPQTSLESKLNLVRQSLDANTYQRLLDANQDDLKLYKAANKKLRLDAEGQSKTTD